MQLSRPELCLVMDFTKLTDLWQLADVMELQAWLMDTFACSKVVDGQGQWDQDPESLLAKIRPVSHTW